MRCMSDSVADPAASPMGRTRAPDFTVLVESPIALTTLHQVVIALTELPARVFVVAPTALRPKLMEVLPWEAVDFVALETIAPRHRLLRWVHRALLYVLTDISFSHQYAAAFDRRIRGLGPVIGMLLRAMGWLPRASGPVVNAIISWVSRLGARNPFPTTVVLTASFSGIPHLLGSRGIQVVTLVESWDHAMKAPVGYRSEIVFTWNEDLCNDWRLTQGDSDVRIGYPFKLAYAVSPGRGGCGAGAMAGARTALYAMTTSANTVSRAWFEDELELVSDVAAGCAKAGWKLVVKPKPNGQPGELETVARSANVRIAQYGRGAGGNDYYLDNQYNRERIAELDRADVVIAAGTTFALDAALAGKPVLQLDIREDSRYPSLRMACRNYHLERYLLSNDKPVLRASRQQPLSGALLEWLLKPDGRAAEFANELRQWMESERGAEEAAVAISVATSHLATCDWPVQAMTRTDVQGLGAGR